LIATIKKVIDTVMNGDRINPEMNPEMNPEIAFTIFFIVLMFLILLFRDAERDTSWSFEDMLQS